MEERLRAFTVTNDGVQIWLPTATFGPFSTLTLACCESRKLYSTITIHLVHRDSSCFRIFGIPSARSWKLELKQHFLPYDDREASYPPFTFKSNFQTLSHDGFVQDHVIPDSMGAEDGSVTLSRDTDFSVIAYVRKKDDTCFAVLLSYCGGLHSAFVTLCTEDFERKVVFLRWKALEGLFLNGRMRYRGCVIQHVHFHRSIQGVRVVHCVPYFSGSTCMVAIDIAWCSGCCTSMSCVVAQDLLAENPQVSGVMMWNALSCRLFQTYGLKVDSHFTHLSLMDSELKLGDYGPVPQDGDKFRPEGNIIGLATGLLLDPVNTPVSTVQDSGSESNVLMTWARKQQDRESMDCHLALYDARCWSLPVNHQFICFLKTISFHLAEKLLVTTIVNSLECHCDTPRAAPALMGNSDLKSWRKLDTSTPLCCVMIPMSWHPVDPDNEVMVMLQKVIDNFHGLVGWAKQPDDSEQAGGTSTHEAAVKFFLDIFGCNNFKDFIGEITFFNALPSIMETGFYDESDTGGDKETRFLIQNVSGEKKLAMMVEDQHIGSLVEYLMQFDDWGWDFNFDIDFPEEPTSNLSKSSPPLHSNKLQKRAASLVLVPFATLKTC